MVTLTVLGLVLFIAASGIAEVGTPIPIPADPQDLTISFSPLRFKDRGGVQISVFSQEKTNYALGLLVPQADTERGKFQIFISVLEPPMKSPEALAECGFSGELLESGRVWRGICAGMENNQGLVVTVLKLTSHTIADLKKLGIRKVMAVIQGGPRTERFLFRREMLVERFNNLPEAGSKTDGPAEKGDGI